MATRESVEALYEKAADAEAAGDTRAAVMALFHAAGGFDALAKAEPCAEAAQGACMTRRAA